MIDLCKKPNIISIHNIASSSKKKLSHLNQERNMHRSSTKQKPSKTVLNNMLVNFDVRGQQEMDFFTAEVLLLCTHILARSNIFYFYKTLTDGLESCGLLVDYYDVFISCLDSHSDGTHSLQRIYWWSSDVMLHFSKSVPIKKKLIYIF